MTDPVILRVMSIFLTAMMVPPLILCSSPTKAETHSWKTGQWSTCFSPSKCGLGRKERPVWCLDPLGLIVSDPNCNASSKPASLDSCFRVCEIHQKALSWKVGQWSWCQPLQERDGLSPVNACHASAGVAKRNVSCVFESENAVGRVKTVGSNACEYFWDKPDTLMSCSLDCPQDCVVSRSFRVNSCENCDAVVTLKTVIVAPEIGGEPCHDLKKMEMCNGNTSSSCNAQNLKGDKEYLLKIGSWGPCLPLADNDSKFLPWDDKGGLSPGVSVIGSKKRNMTCIDASGQQVDFSYCEMERSEWPPLKQICVVPRNAQVSPWSEWRVLKEGCVNSEGRVFPELRTRTRRLIHFARGDDATPFPLLWENARIIKDLPPCHKYKWMLMEWGECVFIEHTGQGRARILQPTCGGGVQQRNVSCLRVSDLVPVNQDLCRELRPITIQRCSIPCRRDCQVSKWSRWGPCLPHNVTDYFDKIVSGFMKRERNVIVEPSIDGRPCPHLHEIDRCVQVELFAWQYGEWSDCALHNPDKLCGKGQRTRGFSCVKSNGDPISEFMCRHHTSSMETTRNCSIPCPEDCVLSEWSEWSLCDRPCSSGQRVGERSRNRTILAIPGTSGELCPRKTEVKDVCNYHGCKVVKWTTSEWSQCSLTNNRTCGEGTQIRQIYCNRGNDNYKTHSLCAAISKPVGSRSCNIPCPVDCLITKFTDWSPCPSSCDSGVIQMRERFIQRNARHGGKPCPQDLQESRSCAVKNELFCLKRKIRLIFQWNIGPWNRCILPSPQENCGRGFQVRSISCRQVDGHAVEMHHCLENQTDVEGRPRYQSSYSVLTIPEQIRSCHVTCVPPLCTLTSWTPWSTSEESYKINRRRWRELVGASALNDACRRSYPLEESESHPLPPSESNIPQSEHWLSCILSDDNRTLTAVNGLLVHQCGNGYRYKTGLSFDKKFLLKPGLEEDMCWIDCPVDCQMSEWTSWSACDVSCGQGFRTRERRILIPANQLGRPCPATQEETELQRDVCNIPCGQFKWLAGGWGRCKLSEKHPSLSCGNGTYFRTVKCLDKITEEVVNETRCDPRLRPESSSSCQIYCPGECVPSEWSMWTECNEPCDSKAFRHRSRRILRPSDVHSSLGCPPLLETNPCILNETCYHHSLSLGPWSSCILPEGSICGEGVQNRLLRCLRSDGRPTDPIRCEKVHFPSKKPASKPCYIDCPIDCIMSQWSEWDDAQCSPGEFTGELRRYRSILQPQSDVGQPCPADMMQRKPCPFTPLCHWNVTEWSSCNLSKADCGYGVRRRQVLCMSNGGLQLDRIHCLMVNVSRSVKIWLDPQWLISAEDKEEEESCHVNCPGDCILTEWSEWSHCHRNCDKGSFVGYATRSRSILSEPSTDYGEPCPEILWETRPCWDEKCLSFDWKSLNKSTVCMRSDGLVVEGGCRGKPRPCHPPCEARNALCDPSTGECFCEPGRTPFYLPTKDPRSTGTLIRCGPHQKMNKTQRPANHAAPTSVVQLKYYPDDTEVSFWMYAMISIGTAFVIFVFVTVYLMCRSSIRRRIVSVQRQASVRRRGVQSPDGNIRPCHC